MPKATPRTNSSVPSKTELVIWGFYLLMCCGKEKTWLSPLLFLCNLSKTKSGWFIALITPLVFFSHDKTACNIIFFTFFFLRFCVMYLLIPLVVGRRRDSESECHYRACAPKKKHIHFALFFLFSYWSMFFCHYFFYFFVPLVAHNLHKKHHKPLYNMEHSLFLLRYVF